jgi:LysR family transcriptional regulator, regulator for metE and metH
MRTPETFRWKISLVMRTPAASARKSCEQLREGIVYVLDVRDMELVVAIAEEGTVTGAGLQLHVTQSALSHRLKDLEARLGVALFLRVRRRMVITSAGESVLASARRVLEEIRRLENEVSGSLKSGRKSVRVSTQCCTCYGWLPNLIATFRARHPQVEVRLDCDLTGQAVELVTSGRSDIGIVYNAPNHPELRVAPLFEDELVFVVSPQHPLAQAAAIEPADLTGETLLVYPPRSESMLVKQILNPRAICPSAILEFRSTEAILELAASGLGVGFLARWAASPYLRLQRVVARPMAREEHRITWSAISLRNHPVHEYFDSVVESLRNTPSLVTV